MDNLVEGDGFAQINCSIIVPSNNHIFEFTLSNLESSILNMSGCTIELNAVRQSHIVIWCIDLDIDYILISFVCELLVGLQSYHFNLREG
jgi:hypothetical protein